MTSTEMLDRSRRRIAERDPEINAVLTLDERAAERAAGTCGPLQGIPVLVKDNIDVAGLPCTAGSRLLAGIKPPRRDAGVVTRLREAGAVVLGKTNMSEWGNFRSTGAPEGWSAVGGQTRNPHAPGHSPWGSSSGSAAAVAAGMVPLALGTETDGSIVCPAGANGVVGVKPETGLLPADGILPISAEQDVPGVLATQVATAATCLAALSGRDDLTAEPPPLAGLTFGLWYTPGLPRTAVDAAAKALAGATLIEIDFGLEYEDLLFEELLALQAGLAPALAAYLATRPGAPADLAALIAANRADTEELRHFGQEVFEAAFDLDDDDREAARLAGIHARGRARHLLDRSGVVAVLAPTNPPAWPLAPGRPDPAPRTSSTLAALAGYPNISLPVTTTDNGLPLGVSLFGPARSAELLPLAAAVEAACRMEDPS